MEPLVQLVSSVVVLVFHFPDDETKVPSVAFGGTGDTCAEPRARSLLSSPLPRTSVSEYLRVQQSDPRECGKSVGAGPPSS
jgi:hypothetical protein